METEPIEGAAEEAEPVAQEQLLVETLEETAELELQQILQALQQIFLVAAEAEHILLHQAADLEARVEQADKVDQHLVNQVVEKLQQIILEAVEVLHSSKLTLVEADLVVVVK